jgi:hypothetical protein
MRIAHRPRTHHAQSVGELRRHLLSSSLLEHGAQLVRDLLVLLPVLCRVDGVAGLRAHDVSSFSFVLYVGAQ